MLTEEELRYEAAATGFQIDILEKVIRLTELLESLHSHPFLKTRFALKGGTALNLFVFALPRLSVDIDLNYIGAVDRDTMLQERPKMEQAIVAVCERLGLQVKRIPQDHAGGKWRLSFTRVSGRPGTLELDVNFMLRSPLWPIRLMDSHPVAGFRAQRIPALDLHELAAGKLGALFARNASRDLFDVRELLCHGGFDDRQLRTGFVVYGGINRRDWREVSLDDVEIVPGDVERYLIPMLRRDLTPSRSELEEWSSELISTCRDELSRVLPLDASELEFLDQLNERGQIVPELIASDPTLQDLIRVHPGLRWKALNVRRHLGRGGED